jgi:hypothetical protein
MLGVASTGSIASRADTPSPLSAVQPLRVAVLPVLGSEKDEALRSEQVARADDELRRLFSERGFAVAGAEATQKALAEAGANRRYRSELDRSVGVSGEVGKALGVDWVVVVSLDGISRRRITAPITDAQETLHEVTLRCWIFGRPSDVGLPAGEKLESQLRADTFEPGAPPRQREAIAAALRLALRKTLVPYAVLKKSL